jgi:hypothetical protein
MQLMEVVGNIYHSFNAKICYYKNYVSFVDMQYEVI